METHTTFAKIPVTLDLTPANKRNSFTCKGCRNKYSPNAPRYKFERYNFCQICVEGTTPPHDMEYETTLEMTIHKKHLNEIYTPTRLEKWKGGPEFFLWVEPGQPWGVSLKFNDGTFFVMNPTQAATKHGVDFPIHFLQCEIMPEQTLEELQTFEISMEKRAKGDFYIRLHRWDLRPFNYNITYAK